MATIEPRPDRAGTRHYRVKIRLRGLPSQTATFPTRAAARRWATVQEGALRERRAFPTPAVAPYTLADLLDRYRQEVLPQKSASTARNQTLHCAWWQQQFGTTRLVALTPALLATARDQLAQTQMRTSCFGLGSGRIGQYHAFVVTPHPGLLPGGISPRVSLRSTLGFSS